MRTAYFDCMFGASGDMILGALVANGVSLDHLHAELAKLGVEGYAVTAESIVDAGISATNVTVTTEEQHVHRHLGDILAIIDGSTLADRIKVRARTVFTRLAEAEATVHGTTPEKIHFHEVGALDAIVDVVGACIGLELLGIERIAATAIHFGTGTVRAAHGVMPVPVPAVVELTRGVPTVRTELDGEITTPTGAAILTALVSSWGALEGFTAETVGYGAGSRRRHGTPNVIRLSVGRMEAAYDTDMPWVIEANIDDMNPELFGYVAERLFAAGALDVYVTPVYMKKGRPGSLLTVVADADTRDRAIDIVLTETTTIGVRMCRVQRRKLRREAGSVATEFGPVRVKTVHVNGTVRVTPEYDDCVRLAREHGVPLLKVYEAVRCGAPS